MRAIAIGLLCGICGIPLQADQQVADKAAVAATKGLFLFESSQSAPSEAAVLAALTGPSEREAAAAARELTYFPDLAKAILSGSHQEISESRMALIRGTLMDLGGLVAEWAQSLLPQEARGPWAVAYRQWMAGQGDEERSKQAGVYVDPDEAPIEPGLPLGHKHHTPQQGILPAAQGPQPQHDPFRLIYWGGDFQVYAGTPQTRSRLLIARYRGRSLPFKVAGAVHGYFVQHPYSESMQEGFSDNGGGYIFWRGPGGLYFYNQGHSQYDSGHLYHCRISDSHLELEPLADLDSPAFPGLPGGRVFYHAKLNTHELYAFDLMSQVDTVVASGPEIRDDVPAEGDAPDPPNVASLSLGKDGERLLFYGQPLLPLSTWEQAINFQGPRDPRLEEALAKLPKVTSDYVQGTCEKSVEPLCEDFDAITWPEPSKAFQSLKALPSGAWRLSLEIPGSKRRALVDFKAYAVPRAGLAVFLDRLAILQPSVDGYETVLSTGGEAGFHRQSEAKP